MIDAGRLYGPWEILGATYRRSRSRCSSAGVSGTGPQIKSKTRNLANVIT
jgi:hypothetical protein